MDALREKLSHNAQACQVRELQRRLPHELATRQVRLANDAEAATKKNTRQSIQRQKRKDKLEKKRLNQRGRQRYPNPIHPPPPQPAPPTEWEVEELWEEAREEVGGLLPEDWRYDEQGYCYADRCIDWLSHSDEQKRLSALYSLQQFLSPLPADRHDSDQRNHIALLCSDHADEIGAQLRRTLDATDRERSVAEKAVAVQLAGLLCLWSRESLEAARLSKLLAALATTATTPEGPTDEASAGTGSHLELNHNDLRAAAIEVLGVVNFLEFYGAHVQKMRIDDEVEAVVQATFMPALRATDSASGSSAAAAASVVSAVLQTLGLLGSLWSPARLATWVEENVELLLECLSHDATVVRQAAVDTLLVFLSIIHDQDADAADESEEGGGEQGEEAVAAWAQIGQHDLYRLAALVEPLVDTYCRRRNLEENHLRRTAKRLLLLIRRLEEDLRHDGNDDADDDDDDDENGEDEAEEQDAPYLRLVLENAPVDHDAVVYQPELIIYTERHMTQMRALMAVTGPSLSIYAQGDVLVDLIRVMIEENELVVSYRTIVDRHSPSVSIDPESMEPIRKHYNYKRVKGSNKSKGVMDRTYANPLALPKPAHPKSAKRLTWAEAYILRGGRGTISCGGGISVARRLSDMGGNVVKPARLEENTNRERDPRNVTSVMEHVNANAQPRFVPLP